MNRKTLLQEGRTQKFLDVLGRGEAWRLSALKAAELLGMNERSFGRYRRRYEEDSLRSLRRWRGLPAGDDGHRRASLGPSITCHPPIRSVPCGIGCGDVPDVERPIGEIFLNDRATCKTPVRGLIVSGWRSEVID